MSYQTRRDGAQSGEAAIPPSEFRPAPLLALSNAVRAALFGGSRQQTVKWSGLKSDGAVSAKTLQVQVLTPGAPIARVNEFHAALANLLATATPCIVTVKGRSYTDLVLINVSRTDSAGQAGRATFSVQFKQIATVETKTVQLPAVPKAKAPKQQNAKPPQDANAEQRKRAESWLVQIGKGTGLQQ